MSRLARWLMVFTLVTSSGCAAVRPWERGAFARRSMTTGFGEQGLAGRYRGKLVETRTGHGAALGAPGGGCGCSQ